MSVENEKRCKKIKTCNNLYILLHNVTEHVNL